MSIPDKIEWALWWGIESYFGSITLPVVTCSRCIQYAIPEHTEQYERRTEVNTYLALLCGGAPVPLLVLTVPAEMILKSDLYLDNCGRSYVVVKWSEDMTLHLDPSCTSTDNLFLRSIGIIQLHHHDKTTMFKIIQAKQVISSTFWAVMGTHSCSMWVRPVRTLNAP